MDQILTGDCLRLLPKVSAGSVDLAFADPPFNIGYEYDVYHDGKSRAEYLACTERWLAAVGRVLKPNGSFYVAIGDDYWPTNAAGELSALPAGHKFAVPPPLFKKIAPEEVADLSQRYGGEEEVVAAA